MAVTVTFYPKTVTWNSVTWDNTSGGPIQFDVELGGEELPDRTGDDEFPTFMAIVNKMCRATLRLREFKQAIQPGTESNMVLTLRVKSGSNPTVTIPNMSFVRVRSNQPRAAVGEAELEFTHRSADGTAIPVS